MCSRKSPLLDAFDILEASAFEFMRDCGELSEFWCCRREARRESRVESSSGQCHPPPLLLLEDGMRSGWLPVISESDASDSSSGISIIGFCFTMVLDGGCVRRMYWDPP